MPWAVSSNKGYLEKERVKIRPEGGERQVGR